MRMSKLPRRLYRPPSARIILQLTKQTVLYTCGANPSPSSSTTRTACSPIFLLTSTPVSRPAHSDHRSTRSLGCRRSLAHRLSRQQVQGARHHRGSAEGRAPSPSRWRCRRPHRPRSATRNPYSHTIWSTSGLRWISSTMAVAYRVLRSRRATSGKPSAACTMSSTAAGARTGSRSTTSCANSTIQDPVSPVYRERVQARK